MRSLLLLALLATIAHAQDEPPTATLTVTTQLVAIDALVRDLANHLLLNLTQSDFTLRVDNHPVPIRYFNADNDLPLTVGLMIDTSGSQRSYFDDEALAGSLFLRNILTHPNDRAFIARFDSQVLLLQKMTSSLPELRNGLRLLDYAPDPNKGTARGGTLLFDAINTISQKVIATEPGRRALIILTDGDDNGSLTDLSHAIQAGQFANAAVYSILYTRENPAYATFAAARPSGIAVMREISAATGGRAFIVRPATPIADIFTEIETDLRSQYRLGFTPPPSKPGKYHSLKLELPDKRFSIQARAGYFTPVDTPAQSSSPTNLK